MLGQQEGKKSADESPVPGGDMVVMPGGVVTMGSMQHYPEEQPLRTKSVASFRIDRTPVTNRQFAAFVAATNFITVAERPLDPADYPGIPIDRLKPGALVFAPPKPGAIVRGPHEWWKYQPGARWRRPEARKSVSAGRLDHPVTCVAYEDALAYAQWAGKRLPSEAEWEWAARGGLVGATYAWGEEWLPGGKAMANTRLGQFPVQDLKPKGAYRTTKVGAFAANGYGLYDMIGNVWEWTDSWYLNDAAPVDRRCCSPAQDSYDPAQPLMRIPRGVLKGGSFLCAAIYCERFRPAARQPQMVDTASVHIGFRCVRDEPVADR